MADHLIATRNLLADKVCVWPDWVDDAGFPAPASEAAGFRARHRLTPDLVLAMYVGSLTRMAGLELYLEAAALLRHRSDVRIVLVGDGAMRAPLEAQIRARDLANIEIVHPLAQADVPSAQAAADVLLMSLAPGMGLAATPSKLIYYLFSERPIIGAVAPGSPAHRLIADAGCGHLVPPGDAAELARRLEALADDPAARAVLGRNARRHALAHYAKASALPRVCDALERIGAQARSRTADEVPGGKSASRRI
jgi:colanic acid biosynthesis glycosyl transferase WcaI